MVCFVMAAAENIDGAKDADARKQAEAMFAHSRNSANARIVVARDEADASLPPGADGGCLTDHFER